MVICLIDVRLKAHGIHDRTCIKAIQATLLNFCYKFLKFPLNYSKPDEKNLKLKFPLLFLKKDVNLVTTSISNNEKNLNKCLSKKKKKKIKTCL